MTGDTGSRHPLRATIDTSTPHSARVYDYWLGGKDNYAADRLLAERILTAIPRQRRHVQANRAFMVRAVRHLVRDAGVRQIVDIGAGLPTRPAVHEIAHSIAPDTRVVYVDNDPIVMAHAEALMTSPRPGQVGYVLGDLRDPASILAAPALRNLLDPDRPTAVLLLAMLMSLPDSEQPGRIVRDLMAPLAPGSHLVATHTTADFDPAAMAAHVAAATEAGMPFTPRSRAEFERFFTGLDLVEPGIVPVLRWRPEPAGPEATEPVDPHSVFIWAGVGRTRS